MVNVETDSTAPLHSCIEYQSITDIGMKRSENQDRCGQVVTPNFKILIVADGMGGAKGGAHAAQVAVDTLDKDLSDLNTLEPEVIYKSILNANKAIFQDSVADPYLSGMGTTLVMLAATEDRVYIANVGDSRAYRIRKGKSLQLTEDHTLVNELLKAGLIEEEQAADHPVAHMLTRSLGPSPKVEVDCFIDSPGPIKDDVYLLCSDGLYNMVSDQEIGEIVSNNSLDEALKKLVNLANSRGGSDNTSIYLIQVKDWEGKEDVAPLGADQHKKALIPYQAHHELITEEDFEKVLFRYQEPGSLKIAAKEVSSKFKFLKSPWLSLGLVGVIFLLSWQYYFSNNFGISKLSNQSASTASVARTFKPIKAKAKTAREKEIHSKNLNKLYDRYLNAITNDKLASLVSSRAVLENNYQYTSDSYFENIDLLNEQNKKLSVWYQKKEKFSKQGAMSFGKEMADFSIELAKKQKKFEDISWQYLQELESLRKKPEDLAAKKQADDLLQKRKEIIKELELSVYAAIQEEIDSINKQIADLIVENSALTSQLDLIDAEIELIEKAEKLEPMDFSREILQLKAEA